MRVLASFFILAFAALIAGGLFLRSVPVNAQSGPATYSVSGYVKDFSLGPTPLSGITLSLTGPVSATVQTDANGYYFIGNLPSDGSYTLTATTPDWVYDTPASFNTYGLNHEIVINVFAQPILIHFSTASYWGHEGSHVTITVDRGFVVGASSVDYTTANGTAQAGTDYVPTAGTLQFSPGEKTKSFTVPIIYEGVAEVNETINLTLSNPINGQFRVQPTATITISDPPPFLISEGNSQRAVALNSVTLMRDPFPLMTEYNFGADQHTRVALFARYIDLFPDEPTSVVTAWAFDSQYRSYPLPVEYVGKVRNFDWLTEIIVKLPADLPSGVISITVVLHNQGSNQAYIRIQ